MNRRILPLGLAVILALTALFCWLQFRPPQVTRLEITPSTVHLTPSGALQLTVTGYLKNGETATQEQLDALSLVWDYEAENGAFMVNDNGYLVAAALGTGNVIVRSEDGMVTARPITVFVEKFDAKSPPLS